MIDSQTGGHLWADRYDGSIDNVFELQDEVSAKVVEALSVQLTRGEVDSLRRVHTNNLEAYELFVRARATPYPPVPERIDSALEMFERVIEMDPNFAGGYAGVSFCLCFGGFWAFSDPSDKIAQAYDMAQKAIAADAAFGWSYTALGFALMHRGQWEEAIGAARDVIRRQPNDADAHAFLGMFLGLVGDHAEGLEAIDQAIRLNPQFIFGPYLNQRGQTQVISGDYAGGVKTFEINIGRGGPVGPPSISYGSAAYMGCDRVEEANNLAARMRTEFPDFSVEKWNYLTLISDDSVRQRFSDLMRAAGIP